MCTGGTFCESLLTASIESSGKHDKKSLLGTSPVVQWLTLCLPIQGVWVQSLVGELISHMPRDQINFKNLYICYIYVGVCVCVLHLQYLLNLTNEGFYLFV